MQLEQDTSVKDEDDQKNIGEIDENETEDIVLSEEEEKDGIIVIRYFKFMTN